MWLQMQREIDEFNTNVENRDERRDQRREYRNRQRANRNHESNDEHKPPSVKNLKVIPICTFDRTHIMIDNDVLYRIMCDTKIGMPKEKNLPFDEISNNEYIYWNKFFFLRKIHRFVKKKAVFHCAIVTDGVGVSILYERSEGATKQQMTRAEIVRKYLNGEFVFELGVDPGLKTWNATVRKTIATGKEVRHN